jgi:O-antigen/teichoic acid export membrane protein
LLHAPKYISGSLISGTVGLLMLKYYTNVFNPEQFGILALYLVMFQYVMTFASLNLDSGGVRVYFDYRKSRRDEYLSTIFWLICIISSIVFLFGMIFMELISNWIEPNSQYIYLITLISGILGSFVGFFFRILFNENKSSLVLEHTILQTLVNHSSSIVFISIFNLGILGRIYGQGFGHLSNSIILLKKLIKNGLFKLKVTFNTKMAQETFLLCLPGLITATLALMFLYVDRIFLKHFMGDTAVGIYTLGFILGQGFSVAYGAVSQSILPKVFNDMKIDYDKARCELEEFSYKYYFALIVITVFISILSPFIVGVLSNETYSEAASVIPFIMAGFMIGGFYKIPILVLSFHKKVWIYPFIALFTFFVNVILNYWLIPIYGLVGAAFASFIGIFLYSMFLQLSSNRYMSSKYNYSVYLLYFFIILANFLIFYL